MLGKIRRLFGGKQSRLDPNFLVENKLNDIYSSIALSQLGTGFLPVSSYAVSPSLVQHLLNDLLINNRKFVVELGSGFSTIYLARLIKERELDTRLVSIDEDATWQSVVARELKRLDCEDKAELVTAPLAENDEGTWFDLNKMKDSALKSIKGQVDCLLVDAPSTGSSINARRYAETFFQNEGYLADAFSVFIDDTYRSVEYDMAVAWRDHSPDVQFEDCQVYCVISKGESFVSRPPTQGHRYRAREYAKRRSEP